MPPLRIKRFVLLILPLAFCFLAGCTRETHDGASRVFTFEWWVPTSIIAGGIVGLAAGIPLRTKNSRLGWALIILGPLAAIFIGPGMMMDKVVVDKQHFSLITGFWFAPTKHDVKFADVASIDLIMEESRGARGRKSQNYYLLCHKKGGADQKVPVGTLMKEGAAGAVLDQARELGIQIVDKLPE